MTIIDGVRMETGPTVLLASGHYFDFIDPDSSNFTMHDLALGQSRECRFVGQCTPVYYVAEHAAHLANLSLNRWPDDMQLAWDFLWHDGPEGLMKDIPRPLKMLLPDYKAVEDRVEPSIFRRLGVCYPFVPLIKEYDLLGQYCEKAQIEPHRTHWPREAEPEMLYLVEGMERQEAYDYFRRTAEKIQALLPFDHPGSAHWDAVL